MDRGTGIPTGGLGGAVELNTSFFRYGHLICAGSVGSFKNYGGQLSVTFPRTMENGHFGILSGWTERVSVREHRHFGRANRRDPQFRIDQLLCITFQHRLSRGHQFSIHAWEPLQTGASLLPCLPMTQMLRSAI